MESQRRQREREILPSGEIIFLQKLKYTFHYAVNMRAGAVLIYTMRTVATPLSLYKAQCTIIAVDSTLQYWLSVVVEQRLVLWELWDTACNSNAIINKNLINFYQSQLVHLILSLVLVFCSACHTNLSVTILLNIMGRYFIMPFITSQVC